MKKLSIAFIILIITNLFILNTTNVSACECAPLDTPKQALTNSKTVFSGKVIDIDKSLIALENKISFQVYNSYKGISDKEITIYTAQDSAACGFKFQENKEYLVYVYEYDGKLETNFCTRTKLLENANDDLKELGSGNKNYPILEEDNLGNNNFIYALAILVILIILGYFIKKRK